MMAKISIVGMFLTAVCGCTSAGHLEARYAVVDDVTDKAPLGVVAVDGKPVQRLHDSWVTVVPMALVDPGEHTLRLKPHDAESPAETTVSATFEAGKRYRLNRENGEVSVVEHRQ